MDMRLQRTHAENAKAFLAFVKAAAAASDAARAEALLRGSV